MFNSKRIEELEKRIKGLEKMLCSHEEMMLRSSQSVHKKIYLILEHLGLTYQDTCTEQLPKLVKKGEIK